MAEIDLSTWPGIAETALLIGCSKRTVERLGQTGKLEARLRRQEGTPPVLVFSPESVAEEAQRRRTAPAPFVLPAVGNGNGNGHASTGIRALRKPEGSYSGDDLIRGLALLISKALQSPPSPPVAESRGGEPTTLFLTVEDAAAYLNWTPRELRRAIRGGDVPVWFGSRRNWRRWRIKRKDLEAL